MTPAATSSDPPSRSMMSPRSAPNERRAAAARAFAALNADAWPWSRPLRRRRLVPSADARGLERCRASASARRSSKAPVPPSRRPLKTAKRGGAPAPTRRLGVAVPGPQEEDWTVTTPSERVASEPRGRLVPSDGTPRRRVCAGHQTRVFQGTRARAPRRRRGVPDRTIDGFAAIGKRHGRRGARARARSQRRRRPDLERLIQRWVIGEASSLGDRCPSASPWPAPRRRRRFSETCRTTSRLRSAIAPRRAPCSVRGAPHIVKADCARGRRARRAGALDDQPRLALEGPSRWTRPPPRLLTNARDHVDLCGAGPRRPACSRLPRRAPRGARCLSEALAQFAALGRVRGRRGRLLI